MSNNGLFISFEGIDGSGKSTQIEELKKYIYNYEKKIIFTREPGGTPEAELIRNLILSKSKNINFEKKTEILLLLAARYEHFKKIIEPSITSNKVVICDRFTDSTIAYQCLGIKSLESFYSAVSKKIIYNFKPNLTILLDISPYEASKRISKRKVKDKYDNKDIEYFSKVRETYLKLAKNNSRIKIFNATKNKNLIATEIKDTITKLIN
jgi:dTMP kinase